ncbi:MAG TPA: nuclear transport factor 2 family protein [Kofleriaceae bacterium]|jgi:uncharacterized protein (TIGR02246 family)|nr:nuclear transport factor 2 family protein [Kofleriaceae bacterium]
MRVNALCLAAAMTLAAGCGGAKGPAKPDPIVAVTPAEVLEAGKGIVEKYRQAYQVRSLDSLAELYSQTDDVVIVHQGADSHGWTAVKAYLDGLLQRAVEVHVKMSNVTVAAIGEAGAAVTAEMARAISDGEATVEEKGVLTLTIRREGDKWVVLHEHFSYRASVP